MKAVYQDRYGPADVLQIREVEKPATASGHVLVKVRAASVNALDWHTMSGKPFLARLMGGLSRPKRPIRGADVAGVVESVGEGITRWKPGDEVFGTADGSFAEYAAAAEGNVAAKPPILTFEQAAAVPIAAFTALEGMRDHGELKAGQKVLVNGAGGGVGTFAVQIAKALGAEVIATTTTQNLELIRSLGASEVIDYTADDFTRGPRRYDVIFDLGANRPLRSYRRVLSPKGTYVMVGAPHGGSLRVVGRLLKIRLFSKLVSQRFRFFIAKGRDEDLVYLKDLLAAGKIVPVIDRTFPLSQASEAIRYVESGRAHGKVVLAVSSQ